VILARRVVNKYLTGQTAIRRTPLDLPLIFVFCSYLLAFYNVYDVEIDLLYWHVREGVILMGASILIVYIVFSSIEDERELRRLVDVILFGALIVLIVGILQMMFPGKALYEFEFLKTRAVTEAKRITSTFAEYELTAEFAALLVPLQLFMIHWEKKTHIRICYYLLLMLTVVTLLATSTRGAFISLVIGLLYLGYLARHIINFRRYLFFLLVIGMAFSFLNLVMTEYGDYTFLFKRLFHTRIEAGMPDTRAVRWPDGLRNALEHPIVGFGPCFRPWWFLYPHNLYIYLVHTTGIIGLSAFLWFIVKLLRYSNKTIKMKQNSGLSFSLGLTTVLQVDMIIFLIDQLKIEYFRNSQYVNFIWLFFGLLITSANIARRVNSNNVN